MWCVCVCVWMGNMDLVGPVLLVLVWAELVPTHSPLMLLKKCLSWTLSMANTCTHVCMYFTCTARVGRWVGGWINIIRCSHQPNPVSVWRASHPPSSNWHCWKLIPIPGAFPRSIGIGKCFLGITCNSNLRGVCVAGFFRAAKFSY